MTVSNCQIRRPGIYWSDNLLEKFQAFKGYDITKYLPALWWQIDNISPKIRYDVNEFLHHQGLSAFFKTFLSWCEQHNVKGRIQPYGFRQTILKLPDSPTFQKWKLQPVKRTSIPGSIHVSDRRKYVASGAHIYGREVISTEAFTFIHWERYRATLEELKIASDGYLRSGATKFYNHGYSYSPEPDIAPSRTIGFAAVLNHQNVWWKYYPLLANYVARCSYILRQGEFAPDIAIYSPLANQWTKDALNARKWTRGFDWGELGDLLLANGYDFDLLNDDALQNFAEIEDGAIAIRAMRYKVLLLPNIESIPLETLKFIEKYAREGGTVIALDRLPAFSVGLQNYQQNDIQVQKIVNDLFNENGEQHFGRGKTWFIRKVIHRPIWWDQYASIFDPFLNTLREIVQPDFSIDFAQQDMRKNNGLAFYHRKLQGSDVYFVANIQDGAVDMPVTFRTMNPRIEKWNPFTGDIENVHHFKVAATGTEIPVRLLPYESMIFVFHPGTSEMHVTRSEFQSIKSVRKSMITALADRNGLHKISLQKNGETTKFSSQIEGIPAPLNISGKWHLRLENNVQPVLEKELDELISWTTDSTLQHFSGTGTYEIAFHLPESYLKADLQLILDLGKVWNIAEIFINDQAVATRWMRGQTFDVTNVVHGGQNKLTVLVTNTLINRVAALTALTDVPPEVAIQFGQGTVTSIPREFGFQPLPASGLLGPVKIIVLKKVEIKI
ncbi:MAG: hypothetical protein H6696_08800 [Deferribacteres bacterium]|nr:hypothetical protein [Deferribacteres bacterium]